MNFNYHIVLLSYNHPHLTAKTLNSVLSLGFPLPQLHLVHNGSLPQHQENLVQQFPKISHLVLPTNKGFSGGANFGLKDVFNKTENILFLTNDTEAISLPQHFPTDLDLFSILILKRNTDQVDSVMGLVNLKTGRLSHAKLLSEVPNSLSLRSYIPGTAFGITKKAFEKLSGFDESLHTYWEDVELSLRAHTLNLHLGCVFDFKIKHKIGKTCHKDRFYTLYLYQRNRKRILKRYGTDAFKIRFYCNYAYDMLKIAKHILSGPHKKTNLSLWWNAIYD